VSSRIKISNVIVSILLGLLFAITASCGSNAPAKVQIKIEFGDDAAESWRPINSVVSRGGIVTWLNSGYAKHEVISGEGLFNSTLSPGQTFSFTFPKSGNFTFHDDLSNSYTEIGTITVR
jgi:plastocyanin